MTREQWTAIRNRDRRYDNVFYYGLKSTKIVCRPSCPARSCSKKNVVIFPSMEAALARGYRACLRCRPDLPDWKGPKAELVESAKAWLEEHYRDKFSLNEIAGALFVNGSYLLRTFRSITGQTLLWYHNHIRCEKAKELLTHPELPISMICTEVGYTSSSHFTRVFHRMTGRTPSAFRAEYLDSLDG